MEYRKALKSGAQGNCLEVGAEWRAAARTGKHCDSCVEVSRPSGFRFRVRDDKYGKRGLGESPVTEYDLHEWLVFVDAVKQGEFDPIDESGRPYALEVTADERLIVVDADGAEVVVPAITDDELVALQRIAEPTH